MKSVYKITLLFGTILVASCHNNSAPNYQYFPNMSQFYETIQSLSIQNGKEGQLPDGTINRGFVPYEYENT
jgi:PBP1b-binding outer membrane lipoprotein LpoB